MPTDEPRQDVETFGKKMSKMDRRISGKGYNTIDLSTLVSIYFIDYDVLAFQLKSACLHDMVDINPKALSADEIIWTLKTKLWSLKVKVIWSPYEGNILDTEGDMADPKLYMNKLVKSQKRGHICGNVQSQDGKARDLSGIIFFRCHKKGNFQYN